MILSRWKDYFQVLLNKDDQQEIKDVEYRTAEAEIERPTEEEIKDIIAALKSNKAPLNAQ